jgi:hypothetical protein
MSYDPPCQIYDISAKVILHQLPLNNDTINIIMSFLDMYLDPNDCMDMFWFKLGRETCNLIEWNSNCMHIVYSGFGKSTNFYKCLLQFSCLNGPMQKLTRSIRSKLDDMICAYYPIGKKSCDENILKISKLESIIDVFYNNSDCKEYPYIKIFNRRFSKEIRVKEKMYILNYIRRLKLYKYYIENYVINKILPEEKIIHKELLKHFNKYGKRIDKLNILENIPIENIE